MRRARLILSRSGHEGAQNVEVIGESLCGVGRPGEEAVGRADVVKDGVAPG